MFLEKYDAISIGHAGTANGHIEIYLFEVEGKNFILHEPNWFSNFFYCNV